MTTMISFRISRVVAVVFISLLLFSCNSKKQGKPIPSTETFSKESLIEANKLAMKTEDKQIEDFLGRVKWKMHATGTGLRYAIYENGTGQAALPGKIAEVAYTVSLISGDTLYTSERLGNKIFTIGRGGVESGLEEGILLLHEGDRAKFILPSHLAYGLMGDQDKIPPKSTLVYDVKLIKIK